MIDAPVILRSTAYCPGSSGSIMADGTRTRIGSVANNRWPFGTRITVHPGFGGRYRFTVRDRGSAAMQLDFWTPSCSYAIRWGRRPVRVSLGWRREIRRGFVLRRRWVT